jgi:hypothetical protein
LDSEFSFQNDFNGFGVDAVFLVQDFFRERGFGVIVGYGNDGLEDDGAGIEIFVDEVDGATGEFYAVIESLALGFEAGEGWQERGMDIEDAIGESLDEVGREEAHVAGQTDQIDFVFVEGGYDLAVEGFAFEALGRENLRGQAAGFGAFNAGGAFAIAEDDSDFGLGNAARGDTIGEGFEVRAATA